VGLTSLQGATKERNRIKKWNVIREKVLRRSTWGGDSPASQVCTGSSLTRKASARWGDSILDERHD